MLKIKNYNKILINQTAFIGDVVLTLPLAAKIKELNPNSEIHFLTTKVSSQIPELLSDIDKVIIFDKRGEDKGIYGIKKVLSKLKNENYDLIISPHRSFRTSIINYLANSKLSISFDRAAFSFLYNKRIQYQYNKHEIDRNLSLLSPFEEFDNNIPSKLNLIFNQDTIEKIDKFIADLSQNESGSKVNLSTLGENKYIIIAPGSVWATKRWLPEYFAELAIKIIDKGYKVILTGSNDDKEICNKIINIVKSENIIDTSGKFSICDTIYLISNSEMIITNDSAPIHFAGLTKTKTLAIFGPTIPEFGFAPIGKNDIIFQNEDLKCRPCAIHGGNKCPLGTHECMKSISPDMVLLKVI